MNITSSCYACGKSFHEGDIIEIGRGQVALATHLTCSRRIENSKVTLKEMLEQSEDECDDLHTVVQMYLDNCMQCRNSAPVAVLRFPESSTKEGIETRTLVRTHEPCATALALLKRTEERHE